MTYARPELSPDQSYTVRPPLDPRPIIVLGAGGIVRDAHLPAYAKAHLPVAGIYNRTPARAHELAERFGIPAVFSSVREAVDAAGPGTVFDLALMPEQYPEVLAQLQDGAAVLIQKPLGNELAEARAVAELCERKGLLAAVNTQLRFAPYVEVARAAVAAGMIGELYDLEIRVQVNTPWHLFPNVLHVRRLEINAHSIHYLDLVRSFLGEPTSVSAVSVPRPGALQNTRTEMLLHYADRPIRVAIGANHDHRFGPQYEQSYIKWEGTLGAIRAQMGLLLDYPAGGPDLLEVQLDSDTTRTWRPLPFSGSWFPDAFIGSMSALQRFIEGSNDSLPTNIADGMLTMNLVEAAYRSAALGGQPTTAESSPSVGQS